MRFDIDFDKHLSVTIAALKNIQKWLYLFTDITDKYLSLSAILLFTFAVDSKGSNILGLSTFDATYVSLISISLYLSV